MRSLSNLIGISVALLSFQVGAIVNGEPADKNQATETVFLSRNPEDLTEHACSGVIVNSHLILTAGHCIQDFGMRFSTIYVANQTAPRSGSFQDKKTMSAVAYQVTVVKSDVPPQYQKVGSDGQKSNDNIQYDIGFIQTQDDLSKKFSVQYPIVAGNDQEVAQVISQGGLSAAGFGMFRYPESPRNFNTTKRVANILLLGLETNGYFTTRGKDEGTGVCKGDSGSGLFGTGNGKRTVIGILSGTVITNGWGDCGKSTAVAKYAALYRQLCWIEQETGIALAPGSTTCLVRSEI